MTSRLYTPSSGAVAVSPGFGSGWDVTTAAVRRPMSTTAMTTALSGTTAAAETSGSNVNVLIAQFVSSPLASAQTIAGSFSAVFRCVETASTADATLQVILRVVTPTGTERGVLYAGQSAALNATPGALGQEFSGTSSTRIIPAGTALTSVAAQAGDRIVAEVGWRALNTLTSSQSASLRFGDPSGTADFALTDSLTTDLRPWIEFSADLPFVLVDERVACRYQGVYASSLSLPAAVVAGDVVVLVVGCTAGGTVTAVTGLGATWSQVIVKTTANPTLNVWVGVNCTGGGTAITVTATNGNMMVASTFFGCATDSTAVAASTSAGVNTTQTSLQSSAVSYNANQLVLGMASHSGATPTAAFSGAGTTSHIATGTSSGRVAVLDCLLPSGASSSTVTYSTPTADGQWDIGMLVLSPPATVDTATPAFAITFGLAAIRTQFAAPAFPVALNLATSPLRTRLAAPAFPVALTLAASPSHLVTPTPAFSLRVELTAVAAIGVVDTATALFELALALAATPTDVPVDAATAAFPVTLGLLAAGVDQPPITANAAFAIQLALVAAGVDLPPILAAAAFPVIFSLGRAQLAEAAFIVQLTLLAAGAAYSQPPNDLFANAIELVGVPAADHGDNYAAGPAEDGEPIISSTGEPADGSVWWSWTAPVSGTAGVLVTSTYGDQPTVEVWRATRAGP